MRWSYSLMKSPKGMRKLFAGSPSQTKTRLYNGFIVQNEQLCKSACGNKYFNTKFKFAENDHWRVQVMDYSEELDLLQKKRQVGCNYSEEK